MLPLLFLAVAGAQNVQPLPPYTITSVMRFVDPVDPAAMNDGFQEAQVLWHKEGVWQIAIRYHPFRQPRVGESPNWRRNDPAMLDYLKPTPSENWDPAMQRELLRQLRADGIDPDQLTDHELVERVSQWAVRRNHQSSEFAVWCVYYPHGEPEVFPALREAFIRQKPALWTSDEKMFENENLGRQMFYNRMSGTCTSSSIYMATIMRALGIPTRMAFFVPPYDANSAKQAALFFDHVHNPRVRSAVRAALHASPGTFMNHIFNEVYVGRHWVRLNYDRLGQPILDNDYLGLMTHVYTTADMSQAPLARTWGMRYYALAASGQARLSSVNPYELVAIEDNRSGPVPQDRTSELHECTVIGLYFPDAPELPDFARRALRHLPRAPSFLISCREWLSDVDYHQMSAFASRATNEFLLTSPGLPPVRARLNGSTWSRENGSFQAYGADIVPDDRAKLVRGAAYVLQAVGNRPDYRWVPEGQGVTLVWK